MNGLTCALKRSQPATAIDTKIEMLSELDIYRTASVLIGQHGEEAAIQAAMKADAMLKRGDVTGQGVWMLDLKAIEEIQHTEHGPGEAVH